MSALNLPSSFLQDAWCRVRLDVIRAAVTATIAELEQLVREEALADDTVAVASDAATARTAALRACSHELLQESGLLAADERPRRPRRKGEDWMFIYDEALVRYRQVALASLRRALG